MVCVRFTRISASPFASTIAYPHLGLPLFVWFDGVKDPSEAIVIVLGRLPVRSRVFLLSSRRSSYKDR